MIPEELPEEAEKRSVVESKTRKRRRRSRGKEEDKSVKFETVALSSVVDF
jgi:hypothetical protein